jgi:hypothetical protein
LGLKGKSGKKGLREQESVTRGYKEGLSEKKEQVRGLEVEE